MKEENDAIMENAIKDNAKAVLAKIMFDMDYSLRQPESNSVLLKSFADEVDDILLMLLNTDKIRNQTAARIVIFIGVSNPCQLINSCKFLFQNAKTDDQLALLVRILSSELIDKTLQPYCDKGGHFSAVLEDILAKSFPDFNMKEVAKKNVDAFQMWSNLLTLLKYVIKDY